MNKSTLFLLSVLPFLTLLSCEGSPSTVLDEIHVTDTVHMTEERGSRITEIELGIDEDLIYFDKPGHPFNDGIPRFYGSEIEYIFFGIKDNETSTEDEEHTYKHDDRYGVLKNYNVRYRTVLSNTISLIVEDESYVGSWRNGNQIFQFNDDGTGVINSITGNSEMTFDWTTNKIYTVLISSLEKMDDNNLIIDGTVFTRVD
ncbi:MAG: hypothetical protein PQJ58_17250 [Spirochaetales bacterium]|nr:hypothetical protein [Spirochaetales bacterium]